MSMHRLSAGNGFRYLLNTTATSDVERTPGLPLVEYYAESGNPRGRWLGGGLSGLGEGQGIPVGTEVSEAAMTAVFGHAADPVTGSALGRPFLTRTGVDGVARPSAVAGYDLTFTVVKSVSVLWALGDENTRTVVTAAHHAAVTQTLAVLEDRVAATRVGHGGASRVATRGVIAAAFDHPDTRHGDPNLHTHVVVANRVQAADGQWRTLDGRVMFAAAVALSETYDGLLADELARRLEVGFGLRDRGPRRSAAFEVDGIDEELLALFSTRARDIDGHFQDMLVDFHADHGRGPSRVETIRLRQTATLATRPIKRARAWADLLTEWGQRARLFTGRAPRDLLAEALDGTYARPLRARDIGPASRQDLAGLAVVGVQARRSTWNGWNLEAEVARLTKPLRFATPRDRLEVHANLVATAQDTCVALHDADGVVDRWTAMARRWTSPAILDAESRLLNAATTGVGPAVDERLASRVAAATTSAQDLPRSLSDRGIGRLSPDQAAALVAVCTSGRGAQVLVGPAGSGKTTTLKAIKGLWSMDRHNTAGVIGLAPSAAAAQELSTALGVRCETTAKWLHETIGPGGQQRAATLTALTDGSQPGTTSGSRADPRGQVAWRLRGEQARWRLKAGQLLIVDEATLAGTLDLDHLLSQAQAAGAGVLLVGDHHQLSAVQAGGVFGLLARRTSTTELTGLWRFADRWEAQATRLLRHGHLDALTAYDTHGRLHDGTRQQMIEDAYQGWRVDHDAGRESLLIAADNATVLELNNRVRTDNITTGRASAAGVDLVDGNTAGVGDRVITRDNNRALPDGKGGHIHNGDTWTITALGDDGSVTVTPAQAVSGQPCRPVRLPGGYVAEHVDLGYAITTQRVQSRTVDTTHVIATRGMSREHLYVALTRGRADNHAYTPLDTGSGVDIEEPHLQADGASLNETGCDVLEQILATSSAEPSATESLESPRYPQTAPRPRLRPQNQPNTLPLPTSPGPDGPGLTR